MYGDTKRTNVTATQAIDETRNHPLRTRIRFALILGALTAFAPLSIDMYLPALPALRNEFHSSESLVQLTLTACVIGLGVGQLIAGPLSDSLGRRRPLLVGLGIYALASLACAFAPSVPALIGLRLVQALAGSAGLVIARAVVRDLFSGKAMAKFFSMLMLVNGLAPILAPVLGGQLLRVTTWRGVFVVLTVVGVLLLAATVFTLPETLPRERRGAGKVSATLRTYLRLVTDRGLLSCVLVAGISFGALFTYVSSSSFVLQSGYHLSPQQFSFVFGANSIGIVLFGQLNGRLVGRFSPRALLGTGLGISAVAGVLLVLAVLFGAGLAVVLVPMWVSVSSVGMIMPNASTLALSDYPDSAGSASALLGFGQFLIGGVTAPVIGLGGANPLPMAASICGFALIALLVYHTMAKPATR
nr:Bcr/CflA family multidrug efflux MFS transporter [Sciscionella sp. SE31]